jgi:hypothetical protein
MSILQLYLSGSLIKGVEVKLSANTEKTLQLLQKIRQLVNEIDENQKRYWKAPTTISEDSSVDNRGFWKGSGVVKDHAHDLNFAAGLVDFLQKEKVLILYKNYKTLKCFYLDIQSPRTWSRNWHIC